MNKTIKCPNLKMVYYFFSIKVKTNPELVLSIIKDKINKKFNKENGKLIKLLLKNNKILIYIITNNTLDTKVNWKEFLDNFADNNQINKDDITILNLESL